MAREFSIFEATDVQVLVTELNTWGANIERAVSEIRNAVLLQGADLEVARNAMVLLDQRTETLNNVGSRAVAELDAIMIAFRSEILQNKVDLNAEILSLGEVLKSELRVLVGQLQSKFLEVEGSIRTLTAATAAAAPGQTDPWFRSNQPGAAAPPQQPQVFQLDASDGTSAPPGVPQHRRILAQPGAVPDFRVDLRNWKSAPLDLDAKPDSFLAWHDRALGLLSGNRLDVRRLLLWAEQRDTPIDALAEQDGARAAGLVHDSVESVSFCLFEATKSLLSDSLLSRARSCGDGRGLELWRRLAAEWRGNAPQVLAAKCRRYTDPPKCTSLLKLWESLPLWEQLGNEIALGGLAIPDLLKAQALEKLIPDSLLQTVVSRPELSSYPAKLQWLKAQMEHAKGAAQAHHVSSDPQELHEVIPESVLWNLHEASQRCAQNNDWAGLAATTAAIQQLYAVSKGKGKGKGKWGKGGDGKGKGKSAAPFDGTCNHCGEHGHRLSQCPKLDQELAAKGKGHNTKGKGTGQGKGGKGLSYAGAEAPQLQPAEQPEAAEPEEQWWMGAAYCLTKDSAEQSPSVPSKKECNPPIPLTNKFAPLLEEDSEEWPALQAKLMTESYSPKCCNAYSTTPGAHSGSHVDSEVPLPTEKDARAPVGEHQAKYTPVAARKRRRKFVALFTKDEVFLQSVAKEPQRPGYRLIEAVLDSGAEESVSPPKLFPGPITPSKMSKAGGSYRVASGHRVPNIGQQSVVFKTDENHLAGIVFQTAEIERPLVSASQLAASGNRVVFNKQGGEIVHEKSGKRTALHKRGGIYVLRMWLPDEPAQGFAGQGR